MPGTGRPRTSPPDEVILADVATGLSLAKIGLKHDIPKSTVAAIVRRARERETASTEKTLPKFPWVIAQEHTRGTIYETMNAYRRHSAGLPCKPEVVKLADNLRRITAERGWVVTYDYDKGFVYTNRRPEDGDAMFVVRQNVAVAPTAQRT